MLGIAVVAACLAPAPALAQDCPGSGLLLFQSAVYTELGLPAAGGVSTGEAPGTGQLAFLTSEDEEGCDPSTGDVVAVEGVRPDVAVAVAGRPSIFVLGARCAGYEGAARLDCVVRPLELDGRVYTGSLQQGDGPPRASRSARRRRAARL